jgi:hypothetical protein
MTNTNKKAPATGGSEGREDRATGETFVSAFDAAQMALQGDQVIAGLHRSGLVANLGMLHTVVLRLEPPLRDVLELQLPPAGGILSPLANRRDGDAQRGSKRRDALVVVNCVLCLHGSIP